MKFYFCLVKFQLVTNFTGLFQNYINIQEQFWDKKMLLKIVCFENCLCKKMFTVVMICNDFFFWAVISSIIGRYLIFTQKLPGALICFSIANEKGKDKMQSYKKFNFQFTHRHHCRLCGRIVCANCSQHALIVEGYGNVKIRVSEDCYNL